MKAIVYTEYGPPEVLHLAERDKPAPKDNEVQVRVRATSVTAGDCNVRNFVFVAAGFRPIARLMFGIQRPKQQVLGVVLAGEVEAIGSQVTQFKPGDPVYGMLDTALGGYAEYACLAQDKALAPRPANLSYEEAAAVPFGGHTALIFLRDRAKVQPGQRVLVYGASGEVGVWAVQLAKAFGAEVTGVCSGPNAELVKSLGASQVIDYTREDFTTRGETYDVIFDTVGKTSFARCQTVLTPNGLFVAGAGALGDMGSAMWTSMRPGRKVIAGPAFATKEHLLTLNELVEAGKVRPVIDRRYPLEQMVEAHRYVDQGHKKGSVVISVG